MTTVQVEQGEIAVAAPNAKGIRMFKGLPYAEAPVGALRFTAPQAPRPWNGVRSANAFGKNSLQGVLFGDIDPSLDGVSEDCLTLNIWSGADLRSAERRPVLFWIHGGGFVVGSGSEPRYDGSNLAARGIVVVTVNHRLNALGFLAHPALRAEDPTAASGNYGMLDLVAALKWVKRNIAAFGGDPDLITIAGESAGSMACSLLMCSPLAKGLFMRVIGQSGGLLSTPAEPLLTLADAEKQGIAFADKLGAKTAADLRALPAQAILDAAPGLGYRPIIDGYFLPSHPRDVFAAGEHSDVPLLAGWNKDEGFNFDIAKWGDGTRSLAEWRKVFFGDAAKAAEAHYPDVKAKQSTRDLGGDLIINHGAWRWMEAHKAHGTAELFRYCFDKAPVTPKDWLGPSEHPDAGAFHSCDIPYVFDNITVFPWRVTEADQQVAKLTADYWANFIKTGNPNGAGLPVWPSNRDAASPCLRVDTTCRVENDIDGERHRFLATLF